MSLAPHEQQTLASIEVSLLKSDPRLARMLATFSAGPRCGMLDWVSTRRPRPRARPLLLLALAGALIALVVLGIIAVQPGGRRTDACITPAGQITGCQAVVPGHGAGSAAPPGGRTAQSRQVQKTAQRSTSST